MKHLKYFFLTFALALCMIAMSGFASRGNYASALDNETTSTFTAPLVINNYTGNYFNKSSGTQGHGLYYEPRVDNGANLQYAEYTYYFQYVLTQTSNGFTFGFTNLKYYDTLVLSDIRTNVYDSSSYYDVEHTPSGNTLTAYYYDTNLGTYGSLNAESYMVNNTYNIFGLNDSTCSFPVWFTEGSTNAFSLFNCNVRTLFVTSGALSSVSLPSNVVVADTTGLNYIQHALTDSDGNKVNIFFVSKNTTPTYTYTGNVGGDTSEYNAGYNDGKQVGYDNGYQEGDDAGYQRGYNYGYEIGEDVGFAQGVAQSNEYTFVGLIGATLDAPINAIRSMFNFEIFGVNLTGFLFGLFTIVIILVVIRKVRGV